MSEPAAVDPPPARPPAEHRPIDGIALFKEVVLDRLQQLRPHITYFHSSQYINDLANGEVCLDGTCKSGSCDANPDAGGNPADPPHDVCWNWPSPSTRTARTIARGMDNLSMGATFDTSPSFTA